MPATAGLAGHEVSWVTDAEEIFSRLVGDQVELCREFIEQNALNVSSLDI
jgi:DNA gyrase subunit B